MGRTVGLLWRSAIGCQLRLSWLQAHKVNCHKETDFFSFYTSMSLSVWFSSASHSLSPVLSLVHSVSLSLLQPKIHYTGVSGTSRLMASWERNVCSFCVGQTERELWHREGKMGDEKKGGGGRNLIIGKKERFGRERRMLVKIEMGWNGVGTGVTCKYKGDDKLLCKWCRLAYPFKIHSSTKSN